MSIRLNLLAAGLAALLPLSAVAGEPEGFDDIVAARSVLGVDRLQQSGFAAEASDWAMAWTDRYGAHGAGFDIAAVDGAIRGQRINISGLERAAIRGDSSAQAQLGLYLLTNGTHVHDQQIAYDYNLQAARAGELMAQSSVGLQLLKGVGVQQNDKQAAYWLEVAATRGHTPAAYEIGMMYVEGRGVEPDPDTARYYLLKAMRAGDPRAEQAIRKYSR